MPAVRAAIGSQGRGPVDPTARLGARWRRARRAIRPVAGRDGHRGGRVRLRPNGEFGGASAGDMRHDIMVRRRRRRGDRRHRPSRHGHRPDRRRPRGPQTGRWLSSRRHLLDRPCNRRDRRRPGTHQRRPDSRGRTHPTGGVLRRAHHSRQRSPEPGHGPPRCQFHVLDHMEALHNLDATIVLKRGVLSRGSSRRYGAVLVRRPCCQAPRQMSIAMSAASRLRDGGCPYLRVKCMAESCWRFQGQLASGIGRRSDLRVRSGCRRYSVGSRL